MNSHYPRDLIGYGPTPPHAKWPDNARIAVQFVLNYEEGGENNVLHGDEHSEQFLSEIIGALPYKDRHMSMESIYEYGSRVGVWRLFELFRRHDIPVTVFAVAMALARNPAVAEAALTAGHAPDLAVSRASRAGRPAATCADPVISASAAGAGAR